jgi:hypothetical protein
MSLAQPNFSISETAGWAANGAAVRRRKAREAVLTLMG